MVAVGVAAEADDLGVDGRAARLRVFELLEHQRAGAFADHEAVAVAIERARRLLGRVVARAGREQGVEHRRFARAQLFGAARDHERRAIEPDRFVGVADALAPEVQALFAGITRPLMPKYTPMFTAAVCGIMRR